MKTIVEVFKGRGAKPWRFRVKARNGEVISQSQGYTRRRRQDARRGGRRAYPGAVER